MTAAPPTRQRAKLAIVLVHYHTPVLLGRAVEALNADLRASDLKADLVVVDNGSRPSDYEFLTSLPVRYLDARENRGYAAALNRGIKSTDAEYLVLMNPDVLVLPGCLSALTRALADGAACSGPRFYWDEAKLFLMPPTEQRTRWAEVRAALSEHEGFLARWARGRWRRHARRFWSAGRTFETESLSGALLAVRREALERIGPFDESFRLYFEENDWLFRLKRAGLSAVHVPSAEAVHFFNRSAALEPAAAEWFAQSKEIFFERYYGRWFCRLLDFLPKPRSLPAKGPPLLPAGPPCVDLTTSARPENWPLWVEISPLARRFPAAATSIRESSAASFSLSREIWRQLPSGRYFLTVSSKMARELVAFSFERTHGPGQEDLQSCRDQGG